MMTKTLSFISVTSMYFPSHCNSCCFNRLLDGKHFGESYNACRCVFSKSALIVIFLKYSLVFLLIRSGENLLDLCVHTHTKSIQQSQLMTNDLNSIRNNYHCIAYLSLPVFVYIIHVKPV